MIARRELSGWRHRRARRRLVTILGWSTVLLILLIVVWTGATILPELATPRRLPTIAPAASGITAAALEWRQQSIALLGVLIQAIGGLAVVATLLFGYRQLGLSRAVQRTERFSKAIGHLSSEKTEARIGALYELERIVFEEQDELVPIAAVVSVFISEQSGRRVRELGEEVMPLPLDLQFALATMQRFKKFAMTATYFKFQIHGADFRRADLRRCDLSWLDLRGCKFEGADLRWTSFDHSRLDGATFDNCNLEHSSFRDCAIEGISLRHAHARAASFRRAVGRGCFEQANFSQVDFEWARLSGSFVGSTLDGSYWWEASLSYGDMSGVDLGRTRGLCDDALGHTKTTVETIMPGKDRATASRERNPAATTDPRG